MASAQNVKMQMIDGLAAIRAGVDHDPVAAIEPRFARHCGGLRHQVSQQGGVLFLGMRLRRDVLFGDHQQVRRRLRIDVRKTKAQFILIHPLGWNSARNDLAKKTIGAH